MKRKAQIKTNADLWPGIALFSVYPLIVSCQKVKNSLSGYAWFSDEDYWYDFFMYAKSAVFLVLAGWMILVLADRILLRGIRKAGWKRWIPLMLYGGLAILSAACSIDKSLSLRGMLEQYENIWVLCGYGITAFYCFHVVEKTEDARILLAALLIGAVFQGILGLFQAAGLDLLSTQPGKAYLMMWQDDAVKQNLSFGFSESGSQKVYLSLYNPNYAAVYLILLLPSAAAGFVWLKKSWKKWSCVLLTGVLTVCLVMSGSKTGLIFLAVMITAAVLWVFPKNKRGWLSIVGCVLLTVAAIAFYDGATEHKVTEGIAQSFKKIYYNMRQIEPMQDAVRIRYKGKNLDLSAEHTEMGDTLKVMEDGESRLPVYWDMEEQCFFIEGEEYANLKFDAYQEENRSWVIMEWKDVVWRFCREGDGPYEYINLYGKPDTISNAATVLPGYERAMSGRGYLWGRIIPLLKDRLLIGTGPDTFVLAFPQDDYMMRINTSKRMLMETPAKAHSMYLQTAVQTGIASLICLLLFWAIYFKESVCALRKRKNRDHAWWMAAGICLGIAGYLLMGLLNDSVVAVAPLFWGMLGVGIALNRDCIKKAGNA